MRLILSGGWFSRQGLFEARIEKVEFFQSLKDCPIEDGFYVFSYELTEETLKLSVKQSPLPRIIKVKLGEIRPYEIRPKGYRLGFVGSCFDRREYIQRIKQVKDFIARGVVYQINLTNRFDFAFEGDLETLFFDFFTKQPTRYAFLLDLEDFSIISCSMELFLEKKGNTLCSKPIKGTGKSPKEILSSEKEKAENLMITDMVRNDMGKIAQVGSVKVKELFQVECFPTLCQMHSCVEAKTNEDFYQIFHALFPPASVTGAPKIKAVQIIDKLEKHARSYYCGCGGLIKGDDFTLSLLIRTAIKKEGLISYFSGCGIVWDSNEEREWEELLLKTKAFASFSEF